MLTRDGRYHIDRLVTYGFAPGYRDISITMVVRDGVQEKEMTLWFAPEDAVIIMQHVLDANRLAWRGGHPLDVKPGESKPEWLV